MKRHNKKHYSDACKHTWFYTYPNTVRDTAIVKCKLHTGVAILTKGSELLKGRNGCKECQTSRRRLGRRVDNTAFIEKARKVHGDKFNYEKVIYVNSQTKVDIVCKTHGTFTQRPAEHLRYGCAKCAGVGKKSTLELITDFIAVHGSKYNYSKVHAISNKQKVVITCKLHGDFTQTPDSHLNGRGCPLCAKSGFDMEKAGTLYYLELPTFGLFKIGITNRTVKERFTKKDQEMFNVLKEVKFASGRDCYSTEQRILKEYREYRYTGTPLLSSGNTELLTTCIVEMEV